MSKKKPPKPAPPPFRRSPMKFGPSALEKFPDHARLLGLIVAEWTSIEQMLISVFGQAIRVNPFIMYPVMGSIYSLHQKLSAMRLVLPLANLPADVQGEVDAVLAEAETLAKLRNKYAHGHYAESSGHPLVLLRLQEINAAKLLDTPASLEEMQQAFTSMRALSGRLMDLMHAITVPEHRAEFFAEIDRLKQQ